MNVTVPVLTIAVGSLATAACGVELVKSGAVLVSVDSQPAPQRLIPPQPPVIDPAVSNGVDSQSVERAGSGRSPQRSAAPRVSAPTTPTEGGQPSATGPAGQFDCGMSAAIPAELDRTTVELHRLDREVSRLTTLLSLTRDDQKKGEISAQIESVLVQQFELRQQSREQELKGLEERVRKLRESFSKRQNAKAEIVKHRLEAIQRDAEGLGWGEANTGEITIEGNFEHVLPAQPAANRSAQSPASSAAPSLKPPSTR